MIGAWWDIIGGCAVPTDGPGAQCFQAPPVGQGPNPLSRCVIGKRRLCVAPGCKRRFVVRRVGQDCCSRPCKRRARYWSRAA
jgi:hypothetical protein